MFSNLSPWLLRMPVVCLAAALMGWIGLILMYLGTPVFPGINDFWTRYVVLASVLIWGVASFLLRNKDLTSWATFGIASPLVGALLVAPPASFAFVIAKGYVAFPVGLVTGVLLYAIVCGTTRRRPAVRAEPLSGRMLNE
jgi:hypothetical protein